MVFKRFFISSNPKDWGLKIDIKLEDMLLTSRRAARLALCYSYSQKIFNIYLIKCDQVKKIKDI